MCVCGVCAFGILGDRVCVTATCTPYCFTYFEAFNILFFPVDLELTSKVSLC